MKTLERGEIILSFYRISYDDVFGDPQHFDACFTTEIHEIPPDEDATRLVASATMMMVPEFCSAT